jgi:hypothetical protein
LLTILSGRRDQFHVDHGSGRTQHAGICSDFDRPIALRQITIATELIRLGASVLSRSFIHSPTEAGERSRTGAPRNAGDNTVEFLNPSYGQLNANLVGTTIRAPIFSTW